MTYTIHSYSNIYIYTNRISWCLSVCVCVCGGGGGGGVAADAIDSSPSNNLRSNLLGQKGFNPLCRCVYICVYS